MKKDISTREAGVTADMQVDKVAEQPFNFPTLGVTVTAASYSEALQKAKEVIKSNKK